MCGCLCFKLRSNNIWYEKGLTPKSVNCGMLYMLLQYANLITSLQINEAVGWMLIRRRAYVDVQFIFATPFGVSIYLYASSPSVGHD